MRILHIATENFAGIPIRLVKAERLLGHYSRLITLMKSPQGYEEDICLELPFLRNSLVQNFRNIFSKTTTISTSKRNLQKFHFWEPSSVFQKFIHRCRDFVWEAKIISEVEKIGGLDSFDLIIADGGHDFFKIKEYLTNSTTPLISIYYGSDFRTRGVFSHIFNKSILNFTFEYDHTVLNPSLEFLFFPYDEEYNGKTDLENSKFIVSHSPTNRKAKGTDRILEALSNISQGIDFEVDLIEGVSYEESMNRKSKSSLFIDQIGELGYGVSSLEALRLGIPTAVEILSDYESILGEHPFYNLKSSNLEEDLRSIITNLQVGKFDSKKGKEWVKEYHSTKVVVSKYLRIVTALLY